MTVEEIERFLKALPTEWRHAETNLKRNVSAQIDDSNGQRVYRLHFTTTDLPL